MRAHDWSGSPLGLVSTWPQSLRSVVSLLLNSKFPMFLAWGDELGFLYNDSYAAILGAKHPHALGRPFREIWAEIWPDISPLIDAALRGEATYRENLPLVMNRKGFDEQTWFTFSYSPAYDESGRVAGMFCAVAETTGQVLAERAVRKSEARLRGVLDGMGESFALLDHEFRIADMNAEALRLEGRPAEEVIGKTHWEAHSDADPALGELFRRAMVERVPASHEHRYVWPDGRVNWLAARIYPVAEGLAVFYSDITGRKLAEEQLRESEARLSALFAQASAGIAQTDLTGRFLSVNDRYCQMVCRTREELLRLRMQDLTHPEDLSVNMPLFRAATAGGPPFEIEKRYIRPDGAIRWMRNSVAGVRGSTGAIESMLAICIDVTDRRVAEERLRESEARFRNMADHTPAMLWVTDPSGYCTYLNARWYEFTGQVTGSGEAFGWLDAVHPDDRAAAQAAFVTANAEQRDYRIEFRVRRADGVYRWTIDAAAARFSDAGEYLGYVGSVIDIDERREIENALREANERLEERVTDALAERKLLADLVEGTDAFVQVVGPDFNWLAINRAAADEFERVYGVRPRAGVSMLDLLADRPEHQAAVWAVWARALAGEEFTTVGEFGDPARARSFYEMKFNVLRGPDARQIGAYHFAYDVTDRIRQQTQLAEAESARRKADALYRAYFENTPEALFVIRVEPDGGFVVEEINPAHEAGVGLELDSVRGRRIEEILPEPAARRVLQTYRRVVRTGAIVQYREQFNLTGEPQHWDTSLVPMRDEAGRIVRLIGSSRNITRQVIAEEALRQSQKMEAMGQLTGGVAHDFNNLLTPIVGALDMLQRKGLGGEREQRLISGAAQSAERAKTLVQRLLAFARRQPLQPVAVDVAQLVAGMAGLIASTTGPQIKVVVDAERDLPPANADPNQLEMAVLNLAVNARDAMPDGGTLRISVAAETVGRQHRSGLKPGHYLHVSVADTGVGMDEATLSRAIEPFFSTKGVGKGTGLGLSMVHGLALQLGGAVAIQSVPGVGTNVELWLPQGGRAEAPAEALVDEPLAVAGRGTALLVDDEDLVRLSTADMLIELGYRVIEAASAEEALRLLNRGLNPEVVVTDHLMPGMSGTDLARVLQNDRPSIKVLIVSGYAETAGIAPDLPRLTKPFRSAELAATLAGLS